MQLSGRPLLDNAADVALFVNRDDVLASLKFAVRAELNILLSGEAGSGKTSLCRKLTYELRTDTQPTPAVFVSGGGIDDPAELLSTITADVMRPGSVSGDVTTGNTEQNLRTLAAATSTTNRRAGTLIVIDDVTASAGHGLFGRLRDRIWALPFTWLVSVRPSERGGLLLPPADAFFEQRMELAPLDVEAVRDLIARRTGDALGDAGERLADTLGGNPRQILDAVRDMLDPAAASPFAADAYAERQAAINALGRPAAMLANELGAVGAASASDPALLDRLGWTRARATQVFSELESAGLVRSDHVRHGPGRPRKVYRLVDRIENRRGREVDDGS